MEPRKAKPRDLSEDEVILAREGRSEEVMGKRKPLDLSEDEVKAASEGRSEEVIGKKQVEAYRKK